MERSYEQFCGVAKALDLLGARWTLLVVRDLLLGPRRYGVLLAELPGITTNLLADRLRRLEEAGLAEKVDDDDASAWALTAHGLQLEPIIMELGRFGATRMRAPLKGERVDIAWGLLSLKRRYRGGLQLELELRVTVDGAIVRQFSLSFLERYLRVRDRPHPAPDAVVTITLAALRGVFFGGADVGAAVAAGDIRAVGDDDIVDRVFGAFAPTALSGTGGVDPAAMNNKPPEAPPKRRRPRAATSSP